MDWPRTARLHVLPHDVLGEAQLEGERVSRGAFETKRGVRAAGLEVERFNQHPGRW
jgi:hypothetical protein